MAGFVLAMFAYYIARWHYVARRVIVYLFLQATLVGGSFFRRSFSLAAVDPAQPRRGRWKRLFKALIQVNPYYPDRVC